MEQRVKLHLGCGSDYWKDGWTNVDYVKEVKADLYHDLTKPLEIEEGSVDLIASNHLFEHLPIQCVEEVLKNWYTILKPGGTLTMEMPDFDGDVKLYVEAKTPYQQARVLERIFGEHSREGQVHHWGWNEERLRGDLERAGFKPENIVFKTPISYHFRELKMPSLRVEATK